VLFRQTGGHPLSNILFQRDLSGDLSVAERRLLDGDIAEILEELYGGRTVKIAVQLVKPWVRRFATSTAKLWFWKDVIIDPH
jgi:hypothetical protein